MTRFFGVLQSHRIQMALLLTLSVIGLGLTVNVWITKFPNVFWDLNVYQAAGAAFQSGQGAYAQDYHGLRFVYAPLVLWLFSLLGDWLTPLFLTLYAIITAWFVIAVPASLRWSLLLVFGVLFHYDLMLRAALTGNLTIFAHLLIILLWLAPANILCRAALLLTISMMALIKPYFAAYFMLWGLRDGKITRDSLLAALALGLVILAWVAQAVLAPDSFAAFLNALDAQAGLGEGNPDIGIGIFRVALWLTHASKPALALHVLVSVALIVGWLLWLRRPLAETDGPAARLLLLTGPLILCLLINPRFKVYDIAAFYMLCIHAAYLWGRARPHLPILPVLGLAVGIFLTDQLDIPFKVTDTLRAVERGGRIALMLAAFSFAVAAVTAIRGRDRTS